MIEAYKVGVTLQFASNGGSFLPDIVKQLTAVEKAVSVAQKGLAGLAAELRTLSGGGRGLAGAARSLDALAKAKLSPDLVQGLKAAEQATSGLVTMQRELAKLSSETAANYRAMSRNTRVTGAAGTPAATTPATPGARRAGQIPP